MRRAREVEHLGDVTDVVTRVLGQLRRGDQPHQIDHAFEVRCALGSEGPAQVFARDLEGVGEKLGADRAPLRPLKRRLPATPPVPTREPLDQIHRAKARQ